MDLTYETIEQAARKLTVKERASLAHNLLRDLDDGENEEVEALWAAEAERRVDAYLRGEMESSPADEVIQRVRDRIRR
jgi:putative addiction module component (TIGR02574 family)